MPARKRGATAPVESATKRRADATSPRANSDVASAQRYPRSENEPSALAELKRYSIVVADTGDFDEIKKFSPQDATTNPSLLLKAAQKPQHAHLLDRALAAARESLQQHENQPVSHSSNKDSITALTSAANPEEDALVEETVDRLFVLFGVETLKRVPGIVSTEVSAALSFDTEGSVQKARKLISLYEKEGVSRKRVLIKLASTWEGCAAAKRLEKENIHCNMTLLFSFCQAVAAAEAQATLISPFVGRILDWHKQQDKLNGVAGVNYEGDEDPGVQRVKRVYQYYKRHGIKTVIMAASFRNIGEVISLAGCDKLTVSPTLLAELEACSGSIITRRLSVSAEAGAAQTGEKEIAAAKGEENAHTGSASAGKAAADDANNQTLSTANKNTAKGSAGGGGAKAGEQRGTSDIKDYDKAISLDEKSFRWELNEDVMATEKLAEGIRIFSRDLLALKRLVAEKIALTSKVDIRDAQQAVKPENVESGIMNTLPANIEATAGTQKVPG